LEHVAAMRNFVTFYEFNLGRNVEQIVEQLWNRTRQNREKNHVTAKILEPVLLQALTTFMQEKNGDVPL
jgi:hypothetical protein